MEATELEDRVNSFEQWHYELDLGHGVVTPIHDPTWVNRHEQRRRYFFDPLVELHGGSLEGRRVLDLGCNAGFWSLQALDEGADFVLGVDGRQMHVDQANLVMEAKGIDRDRYRFEQGNVFQWEPDGTFDVVLCLGLLYHVSKPVELVERCARWGSDVLVVDTSLSAMRGSAFEVVQEVGLDEPRASVESLLVLAPTRQALLDVLADSGYQAVVLRPRFSSWEGADVYRLGTRRAVIASKRAPLAGLDTEPTPKAAVSLARRIASRTIR